MENRFSNLKDEILKRARSADACQGEYKRAYASNNSEELLTVVKDNFNFCCNNRVIDAPLIKEYEDLFNASKIYANVNISEGYLLAWGNATVRAWGNATVEASDNATVEAWGNATVEAWGNATVRASDNATVEAWGNATVEASDNATVRASDNATVEASDNATVRASDNATVEAWGNATVEAWGNAYITSYTIIEAFLKDNAIYRVRQTNTIYYSSETLKFETWTNPQ